MLRSITFGCGQGATKAMLHCIDTGILVKESCFVVNSTIKDIPVDYRDGAIIISDDPDAGCGKVREAARSLMIDWLRENSTTIDSIVDGADYVNIMSTTEGASGSGASVVLAQYIKSQLEIPVIITLITGFETDARGVRNTIEYFKDLEGGDFVVRTFSNKKYLENSSNTFAAEAAANKDIATFINIINEGGIVDSNQNIDDTDHYKLITNPGVMFTASFDIPKNIDELNRIISNLIDNSNCLDFEPSANKVGVYLNISDNNLEMVDTNFTTIKNKLCGNGYVDELFLHRQNVEDEPEFIRIIASGMDLPIDELEDMFGKLKEITSNKNNDSKKTNFFDKLSDMDTSDFVKDTTSIKESNKKDFFAAMEGSSKSEDESSVLGRTKKNRRSKFTGTTTVSNEPKKSKFSTANNNNKNNVEVSYSEDSIKKF